MNLENKTLFKIALLAIILGAVLNGLTFVVKEKPLELAAVFINHPQILEQSSSVNQLNISQLSELPLVGNKDDSMILMFVGDMMLSRAVGQKMEKLNNWQWPFAKIAEYLKSADLLFGNLEGSISDKGKNVGSIYSFRADPRAVEGLKFAGFDVLSVANNHIGDWGRVAMEDTFRILKESEIDYIGGGFGEIEAYQPVIKKIKGTKFDFLAYTALGARWTEAVASSSGVAWLDKERMISDIKAVKAKSDFVIVSIHFGDEYKQKSNSFQKEITHLAIDSGASLVIGHHPHVAQEIEQYLGGYIAYSLGNFIFDQTFSEETMNGLLLKAVVEDKEIKNIELVKIKISKEFQVLIEN